MSPSAPVRRVRLWLMVAGALAASGCAVISGLDQYVKGDASSDATTDQTVSDVGAPDVPTTTDSGNDSSPPEAGGDAGCGPTNTITNCSACGAQCDGTNSNNTTCNGTSCIYQCKAGFSNCDAAAPDLDGCECPTPVCCGSGCATTHNCGVNNLHYYDCVDAGTYDQQQAAKACTAYTGNQFLCNTGTCNNDAGDSLMCGFPDGGGCACWTYTGTAIGHVHLSGNSSCFCASVNDPSWN